MQLRKALQWLILALLAQTSPTTLGAGPEGPLQASGVDPFVSQGAADFLPLEKAYQLTTRLEENDLFLEWRIAPGYYLYRERFKAFLLRPENGELALAQEFLPGVLRYDDYFEKEVEAYYGETRVKVTLPEGEGELDLRVESQGCADAGLCYPPRTQYIAIDHSEGAAIIHDQPPAGQRVEARWSDDGSLLWILFSAALGGIVLNLMPCVFPVLSIKVLSLTSSQLSPHGRHIHGLAYSLGVVTTFVAIALALILLRASGQALGWGFQLQSPGFIAALIYLFFLMGLSFSGFFATGSRLMNLGQGMVQAGGGLSHSYLTGVLATIVASPCTAPFMGAAIGYALLQPTPVALLVFACLGVGMSLPFLVLTWSPGLLSKLPRPGPWMETLRQLLAFPLYLTAIWLLWILGHQRGSDVLALALCGLLALTLAIWLSKFEGRRARGMVLVALMIALALPAVGLRKEASVQRWESYSQARLGQLLDSGRGVFVNLTADWCITCLANEKMALETKAFEDILRQEGILYLKGDWTNYDAEITALLNANGRSGVPLYLFYPPGERRPKVLPQILSKTIVREALTN